MLTPPAETAPHEMQNSLSGQKNADWRRLELQEIKSILNSE